MARHGLGIHLANGEGDTDLVIRTVGNGSYTLLHYQGDQLPELRRRAPESMILVRMYLPNWHTTDPAAWAKESADFYRKNKHLTRHLTWANEQNLADESGGIIGALSWRQATRADYERIHEWNMAWLDAWFKEPGVEDAILHYPALASGHSDDQNDYGFIALNILRPGIDRVPILDRHYYPEQGHIKDKWLGAARVQFTQTLFPGKPIFISEAGNFDVANSLTPQHYLDISYYWQGIDDIIGWTFFIASDPTKAHQVNDMSRNPAIFDVLEKMVRMPKRADWDFAAPKPDAPINNGYNVGEGFRKAEVLVGGWRENEQWHFPNTVHETSLAVGNKGYATWRKASNRTVVVGDDGSLYDDFGNRGNGTLIRLR